jgi:hypothetical protein
MCNYGAIVMTLTLMSLYCNLEYNGNMDMRVTK